MRLEKIEISGFKSFADKTTIEFDKGVTAVVGPNGSGKSNLSEAIKWVLGEQSAKSLRGKRMDDVIFAGSESRKAVNIAEVNLYIDNQDATLGNDQPQVVLTRRLNRNGDSDFFINKKPCRLKDITNLMMDSGLGKDSFALISQGKVEQIFNDKPEERRSIIEEAAGVLKYKDRKYQAQKKLDQTQEHLNRVEDILHEINSQLVPLEEQRERAIEYLSKKEQLTQIETALIAVEIETLNAQWKVALEELEQLKTEIERITTIQDELDQLMNEQYAETSERDQQLTHLQQEYVNLVQKVEQLDGERKVIEQRQQFLKQSDEENKLALTQAEQERVQLKEALDEQRGVQQEKAQREKMAQQKWQQIVDELDLLTQSNSEQLKELQAKYIDLLQEESRLKNQERHFERTMAQNEQLKERLEEEKGTFDEQVQQTNDLIAQKTLEQSTNERRLQQINEKLQSVASNVEQLQQQVFTKRNQVEQQQQTVQQLKANYRSLKQINEDYAGYFQGVRQVLTHKQELAGVVGSVAELIRVDEAYTLAIEIALGANSQFIVVKNEQSAAQAIDFLKRGRYGRATFLPLTVIAPKALPKTILTTIAKNAGFIGVASELVQTGDVYQNMIANLLGTTIVTDSLKSAQAIAKQIEYRYRVVSTDGDIINAGGSITGGATKATQNQSLVRRTAQLQTLKQELATKEQQLEQLQETLAELNAMYQTAAEHVNALSDEKRQLDQALQTIVLQLNYAYEQENNVKKQLATLDIEWDQAQEEYETLEQEYITNREQLNETIEAARTLKSEIDLAQLSQEDRTNTIQQLQIQLQEASAHKATMIEQAAQANKDVQTIELQLKRNQEHIALLSSKQSSQMQNQEQDQQNLAQLEKEFEKQSEALSLSEAQLKELKATKSTLDETIKSNEHKKQHYMQQLQTLFREQAKGETKANRYELAIDQKLNYLSEEYELTFERAIQQADLTVSIEEASQQVRQLKQSIEQMGAINLVAIEEYAKVYERHEFLTKQQTDLLEAKNILEATIDEMDDEVKKRFKQTFDAIQYQFERTFPRLFGGGKATLTLTDPTDLLETGIDIIAQPPGKKLQSLSLLSGGERAFTAIALLFAILEVKPVPFCLLDEVEAALDEANVARYGRYLKEFTQETQFIVITHRRGTMEEADVLYGVTMQDSGVSRLASVKFEDFEEE